MSSFLFTVASFLVALGVLITVHEFGHFWVARRLGVKVLRFSIGFGKALWKRTGRIDGTEYVIAALPLGGYVKMLDEREAPVPEPELERAFNRQPLLARSAIVAAGPLANFLFALFAYWLVFVNGETGMRPLVGEVAEDSVAAHAGFLTGDELLAVGERSTPTWEAAVFAFLSESLADRDLPVRVREENGSERLLRLPAEHMPGLAEDGRILESIGLSPLRPQIPAVIGELKPGEPAQLAGLKPGDRILSADGSPLADWSAWVDYVRAHPGSPIRIDVLRGGRTQELEITPARILTDDGAIGRIGAGVEVDPELYAPYRIEIHYGPVQALGESLQRTWDLSALMLKMLGRMLIGEVSVKNLSGPITIADSAGKSASYGLVHFLKFLAVVSLSLGVLNLLPIPVLDGGHLLFFLIEAVKGRPLSERAMEFAQQFGLVFLLGLMSLAFYLDIVRLLD